MIQATVQRTNASFATWVNFIKSSLLSLGWVQTSDTGQWTGAVPTATNQKAGYLLFRMNDALASTRPVVLKIGVGSGLSTVNNPAMWFAVGRYTDGAGNLVDEAGRPETLYDAYTQTSAPIQISDTGSNALGFASGSPSRFTMILFESSANSIRWDYPNWNWVNANPNDPQRCGGAACFWPGPCRTRDPALSPTLVSVAEGGMFIFNIERARNWDGSFSDEGVVVQWNDRETGSVSQSFLRSQVYIYIDRSRPTPTEPVSPVIINPGKTVFPQPDIFYSYDQAPLDLHTPYVPCASVAPCHTSIPIMPIYSLKDNSLYGPPVVGFTATNKWPFKFEWSSVCNHPCLACASPCFCLGYWPPEGDPAQSYTVRVSLHPNESYVEVDGDPPVLYRAVKHAYLPPPKTTLLNETFLLMRDNGD